MPRNNHIKELRKSLNMKQIDLARKCGVGQGAVSTWETGEVIPKLDALETLSTLFGVSVGYILGLEDTPKENPEIESIDFVLSGEIRDLTDEEKQDVLEYVRFRKSRRTYNR